MGALYAQAHIVKRTKRNQVVRIVKEHYLRDDLANPLKTQVLPSVNVLHGQETTNSRDGTKANVFVLMDASCFPYQVRPTASKDRRLCTVHFEVSPFATAKVFFFFSHFFIGELTLGTYSCRLTCWSEVQERER